MIPKTFHFIWIGNNPIPEYANINIAKWKCLYPDYNFILWNNEKVKEFDISMYDDGVLHDAFRADILRYLILQRYGGIYLDVDFEPLRRIPDTFLNFDFLGAMQNNGEIAIGFIASKSNNMLLHEAIHYIGQSIRSAKVFNYYNNSCIYKITGPEYFHKTCHAYFHKHDYFFFMPEYFYPYWFEQKEKREHENFRLTSPISYAVHHWKCSWKI